ncbi:hypothetical protein Clacol_004491 [Clathrus columnatus]|uniref:Uncharacterized protein n=1 Tax=Clathrus columnatus TaxID=1419009 RepID=A0AAV5ABG7_9AGAM|nr:hypothetical protein Clacol_004491 [Clathrus columnatus]
MSDLTETNPLNLNCRRTVTFPPPGTTTYTVSNSTSSAPKRHANTSGPWLLKITSGPTRPSPTPRLPLPPLMKDSSHEVSKFEAYLYYNGISPRGHWPKLIYRDSEDVFEAPRGPDTRVRSMRLACVPETHEFARDELWERVRDWVAEFLIREGVSVSSVDFVRFTWVKKEEEGEIESEEEEEEEEKEKDGGDDEDEEDFEAAYASMALVKPVTDGDDHYSNPTIWIGIPPDTLTGARAYELTQETFLNGLQVKNVNIAFRESLVKSLASNGPELNAPAEFGDPLQDVIDNVSARIGNLNETVKFLKITIKSLTERVANGIGLPATQYRLEEHAAELTETERKIVDLKGFYVTMNRKWSKLSDRVIGHVVYAPPIGVGGVGSNRFTRDFCIVELDKSKFTHFIGNVLSLDLKALLYERIDVPSEFKYPIDGHLKLKGMLTADDINNPNTLDSTGNRIRRVLKRGFKTNTTVGTLSRFMSFVRHYFTNGGIMESLELPILPHESETGTFSKGGDSGAVIVSPSGEFVGLLTSGTNKGTDGTDITFATLFKYIWDLVLEQYPGTNLYWEDIQAILAATA